MLFPCCPEAKTCKPFPEQNHWNIANSESEKTGPMIRENGWGNLTTAKAVFLGSTFLIAAMFETINFVG